MPNKQTEDQAKRAFSHGSGQAGSDMASDPKKAIEEHRHIDAPTTRPVPRGPEGEKHDHMAERAAEAEDRQEALLDEAIEETFPGSDPISPKHIT
ncbi:MAG: hypothetical protein KKE02_03890 [Alphaproteobacteria bacterium]|nr:hypothetical protein [Alphaproteobacteria bacterium]MBU1513566.1 hypothetical protein [Alphaproteobacteria bacterium]MBU2094789.1 hypothetical protein [Alphaproteobacteria bacterium]MBU2150142.1 hypothetical protein [Alphaproteobacteria bacterium]MBU2309329.1 hypothetical protein [Alphaproteobacteria bacterium]